MIVILPSQYPHCEGFTRLTTFNVGVSGGVKINGPTAGVTHAPAEDEIVAVILLYVPAHKSAIVIEPAAFEVSVTGPCGTPPRLYLISNDVDAYRPLSVIEPLHTPQYVLLANVPVIVIGGLISTNGPMAGVTHAPPEEAIVAVILVYVPAHIPVSVTEPVALVVTVTAACGDPPK